MKQKTSLISAVALLVFLWTPTWSQPEDEHKDGGDDIAAGAASNAAQHNITVLKWENDALTFDIIKKIKTALINSTTDTPVSLALPKMRWPTEAHIDAFFDAISKHGTHLITLDIQELFTFGEYAKRLAAALKGKISIEDLDLRGNDFSLSEFDRSGLSSRISEMTKLKRLHLPSQYAYEGPPKLAEALEKHPTLETLSTYTNEDSLLPVFPRMRALKELDLYFSGLGNRVLVAFREESKSSGKKLALTKFNLEYTSLNSEGIAILAELLKENTTLKSLNLSRNYISDDDACALAKILPSTLQTLHLIDMSIHANGMLALLERRAAGNSELEHIDFRDNIILWDTMNPEQVLNGHQTKISNDPQRQSIFETVSPDKFKSVLEDAFSHSRNPLTLVFSPEFAPPKVYIETLNESRTLKAALVIDSGKLPWDKSIYTLKIEPSQPTAAAGAAAQ